MDSTQISYASAPLAVSISRSRAGPSRSLPHRKGLLSLGQEISQKGSLRLVERAVHHRPSPAGDFLTRADPGRTDTLRGMRGNGCLLWALRISALLYAHPR